MRYEDDQDSPDTVEDVDEDDEEGDEERHPAGDDLGLDGERDPRHHDEHQAGQVHLDQGPRIKDH